MVQIFRMILFGSIMMSSLAKADQFHYQNFLIGDRAIGLGGAYSGVADDASGIFYNPAGTAFALNNDVSGSANAIYQKKIVFKNTLPGHDFTENSNGTVPSFFGGLLKADSVAEGLVIAWGIYSLDSELKDQDDLFSEVDLGANAPCQSGAATPPNNVLNRFHRTVNSRGATEYYGLALGWRLANNMSIGSGANYIQVNELVQEYQDVKQASHFCKTDGGFEPGSLRLTQNIRQKLTAYGVQPVLGIQVSLFGRLSLGLTFKAGSWLSQKFEQTAEIRKVKMLESDQANVEALSETQSLPVLASPSVIGVFQNKGNKTPESNPLGSMAPSIRLGLAWFASTRLLITSDVAHTMAVTDAEKFGGFDYGLYSKEAVTNLMLGMEYYLTPAVPVRLGVFTNNDATPEIDTKKANQRNHVDYLGGTFFLSWVQPNSQIGAGIVLQDGKGKAQKIGGVTTVQDVEARSFTFAFSATTTL